MEAEDEPMDTSETLLDSYFEEGEINTDEDAEDEPKISVRIRSTSPNLFPTKSYTSDTKTFARSSDIIQDDEINKKLSRAKRFSLPVENISLKDNISELIPQLHKELGIDKENERHYRFNAVHMRGTQSMNTEDVFQYFSEFSPSHIEWVNDVSCNIIWLDDISAARALLRLSKRIKNLDKIYLNRDPFSKDVKKMPLDIDTEDIDDSVDASEIDAAIPPGFWRLGIPTPKSTFLLLRYATRSDKKIRNSEKKSEYYKKYGNPHYGNVPGIFSSSLRNGLKKSENNNSSSSNLWVNGSSKNIVPSNDKNNPWQDLAYEWGHTDKVEDFHYSHARPPIKSSLDVLDLRLSLINRKENRKRLQTERQSRHDTDTIEECESKIKFPRMKMYADEEEEKLEKIEGKSLRKNNKPVKKIVDLRTKINKKKSRGDFRFCSERAKKELTPSINSSDSENDNNNSDNVLYCASKRYHSDLRDSINHNKRQGHKLRRSKYYSESEGELNRSDESECEVVSFKKNIGEISPLQIEIENDEYYLSRSTNKKC